MYNEFCNSSKTKHNSNVGVSLMWAQMPIETSFGENLGSNSETRFRVLCIFMSAISPIACESQRLITGT